MKLTGDLKKQVDEAADISEKKKLIEKAVMKLSDDELDMVEGGISYDPKSIRCPNGCNFWGMPGRTCLCCNQEIQLPG